MCVSSVGFASGVLRGVLGEYAVLLLSKLMHLQCTMSSIFDWEVRRLGVRDTLKHGTITVSGFEYFHKNYRFLWGKQCYKDKLGSAIHYTYTSYNKYFRLCVVSEEFRLNEIVSSFSSIDFGNNSTPYNLKI